MHRVAWALQNSKAIGQKCEKPWGNQGFGTERTGTELFDVFPMFFGGSNGSFSLRIMPKLSSKFEEVLDLDGFDAVNGRDGFKTES
jgi:hypothetical protein